jgi:hypothetical protein
LPFSRTNEAVARPCEGRNCDINRSAGFPVATLIVSYLLLVFLVPLVFSAIVSYRALPRGHRCRQCAAESAAVTGRLHRLLGRLGRPVERRWCLQCGWEGYVRRPRPERAAAPRSLKAWPGGRAAQLALDVRSLRVDGRLWRVQLQWWREPEWCRGRLVFIEPSGRLVRDGVQSFRGATQFEVLGQALSIPDRLLTTRLRQLLTTDL